MKPQRPFWLRLIPSSIIINIATLGPLGRVKKAPGTVGSVAGLIWFTLFFLPTGIATYLILGGLTVVFAVVICGEAEIRLQKVDPGEIILDEFIAIPFCFIGLQTFLDQGQAWLIILVGFLLFRLFDIVKPFGIARLQRLEGGFGVVVDDVASALATAVCLNVLVRSTPFFV